MYCSKFEDFISERETIRTALLLNKYPSDFIDKQFNLVFEKFNLQFPLRKLNYNTIRQTVINSPKKEKLRIDYRKTLFIHFTYCSNMNTFPRKFQNLWDKYFNESPIDDIHPILGNRNANNLQQQLVKNR